MKNMFKSTLLIAAVSMAFAATASPRFSSTSGDAPSYDNVGLGYVHVDSDDSIPDFDGFGLTLEKRLAKNWYAGASVSSVENKSGVDGIPDGALSLDTYVAGVGYIIPVSKTTSVDLFAGFTKVSYDQDALAGFSADSGSESGYQLKVNLRQRLGDLEWRISPAYVDLGDDPSGENLNAFSVDLGAEYYVAPSVSLGALVTIGEDSNAMQVGARYHF